MQAPVSALHSSVIAESSARGRTPTLRSKVIAGGTYLLMRQSVGMLVSAAGLLLVVKIIGPKEYGIFAATNALHLFLQSTAAFGADVFLLRTTTDVEANDFDVAATLLLIFGVISAGLAILCLPLLALWVPIDGFSTIGAVQFAIIPIILLGAVPRILLERELNYKRIAEIEVISIVVFQFVALAGAWLGQGAWALAWAFVTQQLLASVLFFRTAGYQYRPKWNWNRVKAILAFGASYSTANWIGQAKILVNPLIVARFGGAEAVAFVALSMRAATLFSLITRTTGRLSLATMPRFRQDGERMSRAVTEGMHAHILLIGPMLVVAGVALPTLLPRVYDATWLPVLDIFPFIAVATLVQSGFSMHMSALITAGRNGAVGWCNTLHLVLIAGATVVLVPRLGAIGYGVAEGVAALSYLAVHYAYVREFRSTDYRLAALWCLAFALAPFWHQVGWFSWIGTVAVMLYPPTWRTFVRYLESVWSVWRTTTP